MRAALPARAIAGMSPPVAKTLAGVRVIWQRVEKARQVDKHGRWTELRTCASSRARVR